MQCVCICCLYHTGLLTGFDHLDYYNYCFLGKLILGCPWPWLAEQKMKESGVCHIAIGEVICCLASRIWCSAVHSHLVDCLILYGQVWVGAKDSFTCLLLLLLATDVTDLHSLLKLDMDNACNEGIRSVFLNRVRTCLPELIGQTP